MSASVKSIRNFGTKNRHDSLRLQLMATEMSRQVGRRIRQRRLEMNLKQRQLADLLESDAVDGQRVSDWERGVNQPSERYLKMLAAVMDRDVAWFYEKETETPDLLAGQADGSQRDRNIETLLERQIQLLDDNRALLLALADALKPQQPAEAPPGPPWAALDRLREDLAARDREASRRAPHTRTSSTG